MTDQIVGVSVLAGSVVVALLIRLLARDGRPLDFDSSPAKRRGTTLLVALVFLNGVTASLAAVLDELSSRFWPQLFAWLAVVLALQAVVVYGALLRIRRAWAHLVLIATLSVFNLFALYLSLLGSFQGLVAANRAAVLGLALLCFGMLFAAVGKGIMPTRSVNGVLVLTMLGPVVGIVLSSFAAAEQVSSLDAFGGIEFRTKPNIHIVLFDALSPAALAREHMGLSELPYGGLLEGDGVTVFKNAFASQVPTRPSLNSLMRLAHPDFAGDLGYFAGRTDGPVTHVFHANGYYVSTGFDRYYLGDQGPFVDAYLPEETRAARSSTLCSLAFDTPLKMFGFCTLGRLLEGSEVDATWPDRVIDIVGSAIDAADTMPQFTLHYVYDPIGHTELDFRSSDPEALESYAAFYDSGAARVTGIMERLQQTVRDGPTPSMLIVMGDHGPFLSRTASLDGDPAFVVQDQYGILAAVLVNDTGCTDKQLQHYSTLYATPERILAAVIRCLASDPARLDAALEFEEAFEFADFLYE